MTDYVINTPLTDKYTTAGTRVIMFKIHENGLLELIIRQSVIPERVAYRQFIRIESAVWMRTSNVQFDMLEMIVTTYCTEAQFYEDFGPDFQRIELPEAMENP